MFRSMLLRRGTGKLETDVPPDAWSQCLKEEDAVLWVDGEEITHEDAALLRATFGLHPLEVQALTREEPRPKVHDYDDHLLVVLHSPVLERREHRVLAPALTIVLGGKFLVTCHQRPIACVEAVRERVRKSPEEMLADGADGLLYWLVDDLVSGYQPVLDQISNLLHAIEERVLRQPSTDLLNQISDIKRELLVLRRTAIPESETILLLSREERPLIDPKRRVYFRDLYDRLSRVSELIETYRDIVTGARDMYLNVISNRMNEVMKTLTIIATIMMPLTLITGIYGMNFDHMPELRSSLGYPAVIALMVLLGVGMLFYFRHRKWL